MTVCFHVGYSPLSCSRDLLWLSLCVAEPEGVFPPEVVTLNSTAVRVLWASPLVPNGAVTQYSVYLDGRLYESTSNGSGSLEVGGLLPFTVHSIQVWPSVSKHTITSFFVFCFFCFMYFILTLNIFMFVANKICVHFQFNFIF